LFSQSTESADGQLIPFIFHFSKNAKKYPMPPVKIMTWNIQNLGNTKLGRPSVMEALAQIVYDADVNALLVLEVQSYAALQDLSARLNAMAAAAAGAAVTTFSHCYFSQWSQTVAAAPGLHAHGEYYGVILRDTASVTVSGYLGPGDFSVAFAGSGPAYAVLPGNTAFANPNYTNYLPLLASVRKGKRLLGGAKKSFLGGRPPAQFLMNIMGTDVTVVSAHTRPHQGTAIAQVDAVRHNSPVGDPAGGPAIFTGDFNIDFAQINNRAIPRTTVMDLAEDMMDTARLDTELTRNMTHFDGSLYDNFLTRGVTATAAIILPSAALTTLSAPQVYALRDAVNDKNGPNRLDELASCTSIRAFKLANRAIRMTNANVEPVFRLLSDHFPIVLTITAVA
jgi:Endonuclease/Exonuclease/phosphatase family